MSKKILITGASSGFDELIAYHLADAGYIVYAGRRGLSGRNTAKAERARS